MQMRGGDPANLTRERIVILQKELRELRIFKKEVEESVFAGIGARFRKVARDFIKYINS